MFEAFNLFDMITIGILLMSLLVGSLRGVLKESLILISWIMSIFMAFQLMDQIALLFEPYISNKQITSFIGFVIVLMACKIILFIVNMWALMVLGWLRGGFIDRFLGCIFGVARGIIVVGIIVLLISYSGAASLVQMHTQAQLHDLSLNIADRLYHHTPESWKHKLREFHQEMLFQGQDLDEARSIIPYMDNASIRKILSMLPGETLNDEDKLFSLSEGELMDMLSDIVIQYHRASEHGLLTDYDIELREDIKEIEQLLTQYEQKYQTPLTSPQRVITHPESLNDEHESPIITTQ